MTLTDNFDVLALHVAYVEIKKLEKAAIDRARVYLELEGKPFINFHNENGFSVRTYLDSLLDADAENVTFYHTDVQGRGETNTISIPREAIFGPPTEKEMDFAEYKRLKAQFEK